MSIPSSVAANAALGTAKLTASIATDLVQGSANVISNFADVLNGGPESADASGQLPGQSSAIAADSQPADSQPAGSPASRSLQKMVAELMHRLGLSSESPVELSLDDHGQVNVTTPSPETGSPADADTRIQLQSYINGSEELKHQLTSLLRDK